MNPTPAIPETWYHRDFAPPARPALQADIQAETVVIGGGLAGLNTALGLVERGRRDVVLLEAATLGYGASGRNGGFVFAGYSLGPRALLRQAGPETARVMYGWTQQAMQLIRNRTRRYGIDCQLRTGGIVLADWFQDDGALEATRQFMCRQFGAAWRYLPREVMRRHIRSRRYGAGLLETDAFHFHPLRYVHGIAAALEAGGGRVFEQCAALTVTRRGDGWEIGTAGGRVCAQQVVVATGGYGPSVDARVRRSVMPIATYVMTTEPLGARAQAVLDTSWAVYDTRFAFDYYRLLPDTRLLWGGRISVRDPRPGHIRQWLQRDMLKVFPQLDGVATDQVWSGWMSYARHQMPVLHELAPGLWSAVGAGGHGMAPTTVFGEVLAEALTGDTGRIRLFQRWPAVGTLGVLGRGGAQCSYWLLQTRDALRVAAARLLPGCKRDA